MHGRPGELVRDRAAGCGADESANAELRRPKRDRRAPVALRLRRVDFFFRFVDPLVDVPYARAIDVFHACLLQRIHALLAKRFQLRSRARPVNLEEIVAILDRRRLSLDIGLDF